MRKRACTWQVPRRAAYPTNRFKQWRGLAMRTDKLAISASPVVRIPQDRPKRQALGAPDCLRGREEEEHHGGRRPRMRRPSDATGSPTASHTRRRGRRVDGPGLADAPDLPDALDARVALAPPSRQAGVWSARS